jgi:PAS domain S-box-containing protein
MMLRLREEKERAEAQIHRQAALIDLSPDAIIVRKMDGTITFCSKGAEKLYGWTKKEALGKNTHELLATGFPQLFDNIVSELKTKQGWSGEIAQKTKAGREVVMQSCWLAEKTEHGQISSILESNVDITERKKAEKEIERLASFPILNPSPVVEVNVDGKITFINPAAKALFPALEELGLNHIFFFDWANVASVFADKNTGTSGREVKIGGHWYHQQLYLVQQTQQIRIYCTDIDELKQAEEARVKAQRLVEEYANQMEALAEQRAQQLQNSERLAAIGQTAGMVGHDIRNPLQAITSDIYLISEEAKTMKDSDNKQAIMESVESVNQNLSYINKIISDLQDYTRPLKPNLQDANLSELVEGTLLTINVPKGVEVVTKISDAAKPLITDVAYMRRILTNLITNAVQAMEDAGTLTVKADAAKGFTTITIQDTGVGIPEEVKEKMFTPLFTTKSKGQGLGLAVVKRLVEALRGTIEFESETGTGTKFTLAFPQTNHP